MNTDTEPVFPLEANSTEAVAKTGGEVHYLRRIPLWKWFLLLLGGLVLFFIAYGISSELSSAPKSWALSIAASLATSAAILVLYHFFLRVTEKSSPCEVAMRTPSGKPFILSLCSGQAVGIAFFAVVTLLIAAFGQYRISGTSWDAGLFLRWWFFFLVVAVGEEVLFRGILYRMIDRRWGKVWALAVSSLLFGFMHLPNEDATLWSSLAIAIEAGLLLGAAYSLSGDLWFPIGIHWMWNFMEGNFFGFDVSGAPTSYRFLIPEVGSKELLTGGDFGPEASVIAVILGIGVSVLFIIISEKRERGVTTSSPIK